MTKSSKEDWKRAFKRLSFRDRMILIIFSVAGLGALLVLFFVFLFKGRVLSGDAYPKALLSSANTKSYKVMSYNDLPYIMNFPDTDYYVAVPGGADVALENGASISYGNNIKLVLSVQSEAVTISEAVSKDWYGYLMGTGANSSASYNKQTNSSGYANSLFFEYEVGSLTVSGGSYTVLTYSYATESGNKILISAVYADETASDTASDVLHRMLYTLQRVSDEDLFSGNYEEGLVADNNSSALGTSLTDEQGDETSMEPVYSDASAEDVSDIDIEPYFIHSDYPIDNGPLFITENPIIEEVITVDSTWADEIVIFYLKYSYRSKVPSVMLVSPYEEVYSPSYSNDDKDGLIAFKVTKPVEGDWTMFVISKNLGFYEIGCVKEQDFER